MVRRWVVGLVLALTLTYVGGARADGTPNQADIITYIYHWSWVYGVDAGDMLRLAMCESRQQPFPRDGSAGEVGPYQFHPFGLWRSTPDAYLGFQAFRDPERNVRMAVWAIAKGYGSHWSCWAIRHKYAPF